MDIKTLFTRTNSALNSAVQRVSPDQLATNMPEYSSYHKGQTLGTYLNICAHENACVPRMLAAEQNIPNNQEFTEDYLQDDFKTNFAALTESANKAVLNATEETLDTTVHMSYADAKARDYLKDIVVQRSMATIDIAQAAGFAPEWPDDLLQEIWNVVEPYAPTLRHYGIHPPEVKVSTSASLRDKRIGTMGRTPHQS